MFLNSVPVATVAVTLVLEGRLAVWAGIVVREMNMDVRERMWY